MDPDPRLLIQLEMITVNYNNKSVFNIYGSGSNTLKELKNEQIK
jgi:hypothetical protein